MSVFKDREEELEELVRKAVEEYFSERVLPELERIVRKAVLEALEEERKKRIQRALKEFEKIYDEVKDEFGLARLDAIRVQLGLAPEEFYAGPVSDYIKRNYQLVSGGHEGFLINGVIYGIIKRK